jgi:SAM-dependent methyltransferase
MLDSSHSPDTETAEAFAYSWNSLPEGPVYTFHQVEDWLLPLTGADITAKRVLELGCGNASLLVHLASFSPAFIEGVDLGRAVESARRNLSRGARCCWAVHQADMCTWRGEQADLTICIGVLHHLANPRAGFEAVLANTKPGGLFHCWVYGWEGNLPVRLLVEPIRRLASRLAPWVTKYLVALPLSIPFFLYSKLVSALRIKSLPMAKYMLWISDRPFRFYWHVAFDQLVTPRTIYIRRSAIESWLAEFTPPIEPGTTYIHQRNGNSWKFGGRKVQAQA